MLTFRHIHQTPARAQRGLSLVELMVGMAVGLFVVGAATMLVTTQLGENRRLLLETQVQQDLRATMDIVTRELRRAGHWTAASQTMWVPGGTQTVNPLQQVQPAAGVASQVDFSYSSPSGPTGPFGFRHNGNVVETRIAGTQSWQQLTDPRTLKVTAFSITPRSGPALRLACTQPCADGTNSCWPTLTVRELEVLIEGEAVNDSAVRRSLQTVVRLRNDRIPSLVCPA